MLRTACGKARLLVSEKFDQFRGLCQENLVWEEMKTSNVGSQADGENLSSGLITLISDLEGFWAMVSLQVDDVRRLFDEVHQLRLNDWKPLLVNEQESGIQTNVNNNDNDSNGGICHSGQSESSIPVKSMKKVSLYFY